MTVMQGSATEAVRDSSFFKRIGDFLHTFAISIQYAKTMQALCSLSDMELSRLGITRADIPNYAEKLIEEGR